MAHALACENLSLRVPERTLCRALTFAIAPGELWAVLGRNGSGKTTLIHTLAGLQPHANGSVRLNNGPLAASSDRQRALEIGVLLQHEDGQFWGSVLEYVRLGRFAWASPWYGWRHEDEDAALAALEAVALAPLARRRFDTLSGGERQRARIAQLLAQAPRYFLLDEPLQHLDLSHQIRTLVVFRDLARQQGSAVAMVLHDALWPGRYCTHALLLHDDGEAQAGTAREMLTRDRLEPLYGCSLTELPHGEGSYFVPHV